MCCNMLYLAAIYLWSQIKTIKIMKTTYSKRESKIGTITKVFGNTSAIVWNTKRRYR